MTFSTCRRSAEPVVLSPMETPTTTHAEPRRRLIVTRPPGVSACQHTERLSLVNEFRRTVSGRSQPDGKSVVCGCCGDRWRFVDRVQLPEWLRAELTQRGLR
jgi:hypothetical protein